MSKESFPDVVDRIYESDSRYDQKAYGFVREGLDHTLKKLKKGAGGANRHVSGGELLDGLKDYTLREFGPMGKMVLNEWGIRQCEDFGNIVFNLVSFGVLGKSDSDSMDDFSDRFAFEEAFVKPFLPKPAEVSKGGRSKGRSKGGRVRAVKSSQKTLSE